MNSLSPTFIFVLFTVLQQSQCFSRFNTHNYHLEYRELRGSLDCFRTLTMIFLEHLKTVVSKSCIGEEEEEFGFKINSRTSTFDSIIKYGRYHEQFVQEMQKAEEIGTKVITKICPCLADKCSDERQGIIKYFIHVFRANSARCGDSSYLSSALTTLENTCAKHENEDGFNEMKWDDDDDSAREKGKTRSYG